MPALAASSASGFADRRAQPGAVGHRSAMLLRFVPYIGSLARRACCRSRSPRRCRPGWSLALVDRRAVSRLRDRSPARWSSRCVYGHSTGLSPVAVMIAAIFWTWLWGPIGLILSTPLTLCLVVLGRHFERLEFLDVMLGDRPALSPVESFYQRMLAGDPDEARGPGRAAAARAAAVCPTTTRWRSRVCSSPPTTPRAAC